MVRFAKHDQIVGFVRAAVLAMDDVMDVEVARRAAARHRAARSIAPHDEAANARRDVLPSACRLAAVERTEMLRVAQRAFEAGRVEWRREAIAVLPSRFAALAHGYRDLILRASGVALVDRIGGVVRRGLDRCGRIEYDREQRIEECLVVEPATVAAFEHGLRLTIARVGRLIDFEAQHAIDEHRIRRVGRQVAGLVAADELLDLLHALVLRRVDPLRFGLGRHDARQLAHGRKRHLGSRERLGEHGQLVERERDAQTLLRGTRAIPEPAFHVLEQRRAAELAPDVHAVGFAQPLRFLGVDLCALLREPAQRAIDRFPFALGFVGHCTAHHSLRLPR